MVAAVVVAVVLAHLLEVQEAKALQEEPQSLVMLAQVVAVWEALALLTAGGWVAQEVRVLPIQSQELLLVMRRVVAAAVHRVQLLYWVDLRMEL